MGSFVEALLVFLSSCCWGNGVAEASVAGEKTSHSKTTAEKHALYKFKILMEPVLFDDGLKEEACLVRWLRGSSEFKSFNNINNKLSHAVTSVSLHRLSASRFDVKKAERMPLEFQMDAIHEEDWSEFQERFPYVVSFDKEFQPSQTHQYTYPINKSYHFYAKVIQLNCSN
ncbi:hypothetical protein Fcan01_27209 [Folsomia candida]|uniref:Uncharacterized protein n=1 Tax=Folsomia candida TaxID=158441 RepID=A0A226CZP5_FOLCA|nr:hypothetical protein Fcan01_27209 [Folsomia candida]